MVRAFDHGLVPARENVGVIPLQSHPHAFKFSNNTRPAVKRDGLGSNQTTNSKL
jgi:hypothetical protein